jgi:hypothetical protein
LAPQALGGWWFLLLMVLGIAVILMVVCQALLMKDQRMAVWKKALTGILVLAATVLAGEWFVATGGMTAIERSHPLQRHSVVLRWQPSTTKNVRYNVYRGSSSGIHPDKLNDPPIDGLTFTDSTAETGRTYYYVVRAIDAARLESADSNEQLATIP